MHSTRSHSAIPEVVAILRDLIQARLGLYFDDGKTDYLVDRLAPLVTARGLPSLLDYYYLLRYDEKRAAEEWDRVADALTVNETFFWREVDQILVVANQIAPDYFSRFPGKKLRIWSAACSTGEEPLSIAMAMSEAGLLDPKRVEIVATDVSSRALERAKAGVYGERAFRFLPPELKEKYFLQETDGWRVDPQLQRVISWEKANLLDPEVVRKYASPIVFCRNVFIYFSKETVAQIAQNLYQHMPAPGYLFLGAAESLLRLETGFEFQMIGNAFAYVKREGGTSS
ncbi:MAG: protein-glutamate O-methyltransferase CheR [Thermoleophilia bacterium]|nr:protein-glutamate O-methyltransferase CheR [Thermoleophilia bacterium]